MKILKALPLFVMFVIFGSGKSGLTKGAGYKSIIVQHEISSIKKTGDIIKIDGKVISENKNLPSFIADVKQSKISFSYKWSGIPDFILSFLQQLTSDHFTIADAGKDWNCCCDHNESLPNRQLIEYGNSNNLFIISYLTGGFGVSEHLILITYRNKIITDFWTGTMLNENLQTKQGILNCLIKEGKINNVSNI